jgi:signal transduction histidine kinase
MPTKRNVAEPRRKPAPAAPEPKAKLLRELVAHLRRNRTQLRREWAWRIREAKLLTAMSAKEIFFEATSVYDNYVEVLETGRVKALQAYAQDLSERIIPRGVETHEVLGIVLLLRDVLARSLFQKYQGDFDLLSRVLDAYEPAANRIANTVGVSFVAERERVIREQQEAIRQADLMHRDLRTFSRQILHVLEAERKRLSRELHDEIGQALTALNTNMALMRHHETSDARWRRKKIADSERLMQQTAESVRRFAHELRPAMLDELGLVPALRSYLKDFAGRTGIRVRFHSDDAMERLRDEQKIVVYRVIQESLTNVAKHAHASRVTVALRRQGHGVQVQVTDNGASFPAPQQPAARGPKRLGLLGMQERVRLVDGHLAIEPVPGIGTTIRAEFPSRVSRGRLAAQIAAAAP